MCSLSFAAGLREHGSCMSVVQPGMNTSTGRSNRIAQDAQAAVGSQAPVLLQADPQGDALGLAFTARTQTSLFVLSQCSLCLPKRNRDFSNCSQEFKIGLNSKILFSSTTHPSIHDPSIMFSSKTRFAQFPCCSSVLSQCLPRIQHCQTCNCPV